MLRCLRIPSKMAGTQECEAAFIKISVKMENPSAPYFMESGRPVPASILL